MYIQVLLTMCLVHFNRNFEWNVDTFRLLQGVISNDRHCFECYGWVFGLFITLLFSPFFLLLKCFICCCSCIFVILMCFLVVFDLFLCFSFLLLGVFVNFCYAQAVHFGRISSETHKITETCMYVYIYTRHAFNSYQKTTCTLTLSLPFLPFKNKIKVQNKFEIIMAFPPSHLHMKRLITKCAVLKVDFL